MLRLDPPCREPADDAEETSPLLSPSSLSLRPRVSLPKTRIHVRLLGPCFKTGRATPSHRQFRKTMALAPSPPAAADPRCSRRRKPRGRRLRAMARASADALALALLTVRGNGRRAGLYDPGEANPPEHPARPLPRPREPMSIRRPRRREPAEMRPRRRSRPSTTREKTNAGSVSLPAAPPDDGHRRRTFSL